MAGVALGAQVSDELHGPDGVRPEIVAYLRQPWPWWKWPLLWVAAPFAVLMLVGKLVWEARLVGPCPRWRWFAWRTRRWYLGAWWDAGCRAVRVGPFAFGWERRKAP